MTALISLYDHQAEIVTAAAAGLEKYKAFMIQGATGIGKTRIFANITGRIFLRYPEHRVWIIVPRTELMDQASANLTAARLPHAKIGAGMHESRAYRVHIVSKQTLDRRWGQIKNPPEWIFVDEAHLNFEFQKRLREEFPDAYILGFTATPERTSGEGLKEKWVTEGEEDEHTRQAQVSGLDRGHEGDSSESRTNSEAHVPHDGKIDQPLRSTLSSPTRKNLGGIYGGIHYGPSIPWLTERGFLAALRYYGPPPPDGLEKLHYKNGEAVEKDLSQYLAENKVFGKVVEYYKLHGKRKPDHLRFSKHPNKPALIFCGSVEDSKATAQEFRDNGFQFFSIDGAMNKGERKMLIKALKEETIDGLTNCDLATYGLDVPNLEYGSSIRPTQSRSLYFQMIGRLLRPCDGKPDAVFVDHVNLYRRHEDPRYPGVPLFYLDDITWNFEGRVREKRKVKEGPFLAYCPLIVGYCTDPGCAAGCKKNPDHELTPGRKPVEVDDTVPLVEIKVPVKFAELPPEEKRDAQDRMGRAADKWLASGGLDPGPVGELLKMASELGRKPLWVFHFLTEKSGKKAVNFPLLFEIARQKGYSKGWPYMVAKDLKLKQASPVLQ